MYFPPQNTSFWYKRVRWVSALEESAAAQPRFFLMSVILSVSRELCRKTGLEAYDRIIFLVMCEGSKAPGSSKQARLDDRLTAVLLYSPRAPFMKCKPHKGQDVLSELRIILLERWCDLTLGVMQKRKNRKNKNSNRSSLLLYKGRALCVWIRSCFFVPLQMVATNVKLMQYGFMGFYSEGASSSVRCQSC